MRTYRLQKCIFDHLRAVQRGQGESVRPEDYGLDDEEHRAFEEGDIRRLYELHVHHVLLNAFARSRGLSRDDYRGLLQGLEHEYAEVPVWRRS